MGTDVMRLKFRQSPMAQAIHGSKVVPAVKKMAIDRFATIVRYLGPTYSSTAEKQWKM